MDVYSHTTERQKMTGGALRSRVRRMLAPAVESWSYLRSRGVRKTCSRFLEAYVFAMEEWAVLRNDLAGPPLEAVADGVVFRPFAPGDDHFLCAFEPWHLASELRAQLGDGCWLDFAFDGDRPVAYRVVSPTGPRRQPLGTMITLKPAQLWVVNLFCLPEYRARGIGRRLSVAMDRRLSTIGYREILMANRLDNVPTVRLSLTKGNELLFWFSYLRVLFYSRYRVSTDAARVTEVASRRLER